MRLRHDIITRLTRAVLAPDEERPWLGVSNAERLIIELFDDYTPITGVAGGDDEVPAAFQLLIKAKPSGKRDTSVLIDDGASNELILSASHWDADESNGQGALVIETANTFNTAVYDLLGLGNDDATDDEPSAICDLELSYRASSGDDWQKGRPLEFDLTASVNLDDDATPTAIAGSRGPRFYPDITGLTGGGTTKLDGLVTTTLTVPTWIMIYRTGVGPQDWLLVSGTDAENGNTIIRPDDYAASTNEKVWKLIR